MLPKQDRLPLRTELKRVQKEGKIYQSPFFGLIVNKRQVTSDKEDASRFGFIVSKRISRKAVERNRVKRLLSEAVRRLLPRIKLGWEGVFLAKKTILGRGFKEVLREVERVFEKAEVLLKT